MRVFSENQKIASVVVAWVMLASCDSRQDLMHGYNIRHGEGSELYLFKDEEGVTPYVSMIAVGDDFFVVETWSLAGKVFSLDDISCQYQLVDRNGMRNAQISDLNGTIVETMNSLSCIGRRQEVTFGSRIADVENLR